MQNIITYLQVSDVVAQIVDPYNQALKSTPTMTRGMRANLCLRLLDSEGIPVAIESLNYASWDFVLANDWNDETAPQIRVTSGVTIDSITIEDKTYSQINIPLTKLNTTELIAALSSANAITLGAELAGFESGETDPAFLIQFDVSISNRRGTAGTGTPEPVEDGVYSSVQIDALLDAKQSISEKGAANGYPGLDETGKVPVSQISATVINDTFTAASEAEQLALTAQNGDVCVRTDLNKSYIHNSGTAGTMADWQELLTPTDAVLSVAGKTGAVVLVAGDITDFDAEVGSHTDVAANTSARHDHANKATLDTLTNAGDGSQFLANDGTYKTPSGGGAGDMLAATYDPTTKAADAFDMGNMAEAADAKVMTAAERAKLGNAPDDTNTALAGKSATDHTHGELHSHANKALLDAYTQTETNLADAVTKKHSHANSSTLGAIPDHATATTGQTIKKQADGSLAFEDEAGGSSWDGDITDIDLDGGTDIGANLTDADLILVDGGAGGTNRKSALSRLWTYISGKLTSAALTLTNKTIDADNNTISNIGSSEIKSDIITGLADKSSPSISDYMMLYDTGGTALKKFDIRSLPGMIADASEKTADAIISSSEFKRLTTLGPSTTADKTFTLSSMFNYSETCFFFKNRSAYILTLLGELKSTDATEAGTTATNITATAHGFNVGRVLKMTSGSLSGEIRVISAIVDSNNFTLSPALTAVPSVGDTFEVRDAIDGGYSLKLGPKESATLINANLSIAEWLVV